MNPHNPPIRFTGMSAAPVCPHCTGSPLAGSPLTALLQVNDPRPGVSTPLYYGCLGCLETRLIMANKALANSLHAASTATVPPDVHRLIADLWRALTTPTDADAIDALAMRVLPYRQPGWP